MQGAGNSMPKMALQKANANFRSTANCGMVERTNSNNKNSVNRWTAAGRIPKQGSASAHTMLKFDGKGEIRNVEFDVVRCGKFYFCGSMGSLLSWPHWRNSWGLP